MRELTAIPGNRDQGTFDSYKALRVEIAKINRLESQVQMLSIKVTLLEELVNKLLNGRT